MRQFLFILTVLSIACSCSEKKAVTRRGDYTDALNGAFLMTADNEESDLAFWSERLRRRPNDVSSLFKLAAGYSARFDSRGAMIDLFRSDSIYGILLEHPAANSASVYQMLTLNAMTRHDFRAAEHFIGQALQTGDQMSTSYLILADVAFERGFYAKSRHMLEKYANKNAFTYLIRNAKLLDQTGDQTEAIAAMEKAYHRISGNRSLACWTLSTLGDMYGHAGRISDAYHAYLLALDRDPGYAYALRGIAWIAISHDQKMDEAREIIRVLSSTNHKMPDLNLMMAEIAAAEGNADELKSCYEEFMRLTGREGYATMYGKYRAIVLADQYDNAEQCIAIAKREIENRPTPQSYDLLAWGYYRNGQFDDALKVANQYVVGKTIEPQALYHAGMIGKSAGLNRQSRKLLEEAAGSSFELGPVLTKALQRSIDELN
jgi:tetratricopeptide (TPR) repeat protein